MEQDRGVGAKHLELWKIRATLLYTDGSKCPVINSVSLDKYWQLNKYWQLSVFVSCSDELYSWKLDPRHSVLGSELYAIQRAIEITNSMHELHSKNIVFLTDSRTACMMLLSPTGTCSSTVENIRSLLVKCNKKNQLKFSG